MRFFFLTTPPENATGPWLPGQELARHLKALRFKSGEEMLLLPEQGEAYLAVFHSTERLELLGRVDRPILPLLDVTLATAWPKGSRSDDLVRRCSENGVTRILPVACTRSVVGRGELSPAREQRWQKIVQEVCQQTRRPILPEIHIQPIPLKDLRDAVPDAHAIALVPGTWPLGMELDLHRPKRILLVVGPEGGFTDEEEALLRDQKYSFAGLSPTILRIEAAGPLAIGLCQHHFLMRQGH
jgi:16S rRNA (uracil1498-N3)-methyltransferase